MQNSHSFKSYVLDPSQVAGFKANLQHLGFEAGAASANASASGYTAWTSSNRANSNDNIKVLETKL